MSIVSHALVYSSPNGTRLDVRYRFVDHLGVEILVDKSQRWDDIPEEML